VDAAQWTAFYGVLATTNDGKPRPIDFRSQSGAVGMFAIPSRRFADLKIGAAAASRMLRDPLAQHSALVASLRLYFTLPVPDGMTRSGALSILHCTGRPDGIAQWQKRPLAPTTALFQRANGLF
jgi:hypothetical protein